MFLRNKICQLRLKYWPISLAVIALLLCSCSQSEPAESSSNLEKSAHSEKSGQLSALDEDNTLGPNESSDGAKDRGLPLPANVFSVLKHTAWVMLPSSSHSRQVTPWVWFAHSRLNGNPRDVHKEMFQNLLDSGVAVAGIDAGETYGSPQGQALFDEFYLQLVKQYNFSTRPCLLAQSRGGLELYNWAIGHANSVACIAGIFPVLDISKYPGIKKASYAYGMSREALAASLSKYNPIDRVKVLAEQNIPILHLHGDQDDIVPLEEHSGLLQKRLHEFGGTMQLVVVPGQGHTLWPGYFTDRRLIDFVISNATK